MQRGIVTHLEFARTTPAQNKYTLRIKYVVFLDADAWYSETTADVNLLDVLSTIQGNIAAAVKADALAKYGVTLGLGEVLLPAMALA